jgi:tRNA threonylcarbamoyladenosine biosynthesis protein TsaB
MLILTIRTDKPEAELGLFEDDKKLVYLTWPAHRELAETIHQKMKELLGSQRKSLSDLQAISVFKGPGSFTGLRIGVSVANTLADSLRIPAVGTGGDEWIAQAARRLAAHENDRVVSPEYGAPPHITPPRH